MNELFLGVQTWIVREAQKQSSSGAPTERTRCTWREVFEAQNKARVADGQRLRAAIRAITAQHQGADPLRAREVRRALRIQGVDPLPSLRCVQWHLTALRREFALAHPAPADRRD